MTNKLAKMLEESQARDPETIAEEKRVRGPHRAVITNPMTDGNQHLQEDPDKLEKEVEEVVRTKPKRAYGITGVRLIKVGDFEFKIVRRDPYGFWFVTGSGVPKVLAENTFTSVGEAERAITIWANGKTAHPPGYLKDGEVL